MANVLSVLAVIWLASTSFASVSVDAAADSLARLSDHHRVLFIGESHSLRDARRLTLKTLERGLENGSVDTFATEYVLEDDEQAFQIYLDDHSAGPGSLGETQFFQRSLDRQYVWFKDDRNKDFIRGLRGLKQKYPNLRICGVDVEDSTDLAVRKSRLESMPSSLKAAARQAFRLSIADMILNSNRSFDRETRMALLASRCIEKSRHAILHVGMTHAWSVNYSRAKFESAEERREPGWSTMSQLLKAMKPQLSIATAVTLQAFRKPGASLEHAESQLRLESAYRWRKQSGFAGLSVVESKSVPAALKQILTEKSEDGRGVSYADVWDYLIIGPEGEYSSIFD